MIFIYYIYIFYDILSYLLSKLFENETNVLVMSNHTQFFILGFPCVCKLADSKPLAGYPG